MYIVTVLNEFPKDGSIRRPIFCALTQENINWPLKQLVEHLLEEDKRWKNREAPVRAQAPDSYEDRSS